MQKTAVRKILNRFFIWSKNHKKTIITLGILTYVITPMLMDFFILGNNIKSNIDNSTWASFLGGYLGGGFSLLGIALTINFTRQQADEDRAAEYMPYLTFLYTEKKAVDNTYLRVFNCINSNVEKSYNYDLCISINNVGNGNAYKTEISDLQYDDGERNYNCESEYIAIITKEKEIIIPLKFYISTFKLNDGKFYEKKDINKKIASIKTGRLHFKITYFDVFNHRYENKVELKINAEQIKWSLNETKQLYSIKVTYECEEVSIHTKKS